MKHCPTCACDDQPADDVHATVNFNGLFANPDSVARQIQNLILRLSRRDPPPAR